eukprot:355021-Chlamydomonas_euryale.AAC.17
MSPAWVFARSAQAIASDRAGFAAFVGRPVVIACQFAGSQDVWEGRVDGLRCAAHNTCLATDTYYGGAPSPSGAQATTRYAAARSSAIDSDGVWIRQAEPSARAADRASGAGTALPAAPFLIPRERLTLWASEFLRCQLRRPPSLAWP